jgi:cytidine deaminase
MDAVTTFKDIEDLDAESKYLVHKAKEASMHAYAPYSKFFVGASLILEDGTVVTGANQENASYPLCMCAERIALYTAGVEHPGKKIIKMAVIAHKKNHKELLPATSCGACRQVMHEFEMRQKSPIEVVMLATAQQWIKVSTVDALLPFGFTKDNLHQDRKK